MSMILTININLDAYDFNTKFKGSFTCKFDFTLSLQIYCTNNIFFVL